MRTREERIAAFLKSQQREITLDEATRIIAEEGLDQYKRIEINNNNISDNCAIINSKKDGGYILIITDEKGNIIREVSAVTINNAYFKLVEELRSIKKNSGLTTDMSNSSKFLL